MNTEEPAPINPPEPETSPPPDKPKGLNAAEKAALLQAFDQRESSADAFCAQHGVSAPTLYTWRRNFKAYGMVGLEGGAPSRKRKKVQSVYSPDQRRKAVETLKKTGQSTEDFARLWGVNPRSLRMWVRKYDQGGPKSLESRMGRRPGRKPLAPELRDQIVGVKQRFPEFGLRKVRDFLARFRGVKASPHKIRRAIKEANLPPTQAPAKRWRKRPQVTFFERARPGELWQSDITSFVLPRYGQRVYLVAFMDDHSRYVVSWKLGLKQTTDFVQEALLEGIQRWGKPLEVLTDQGRQYFAWRGKSDFQRLLEKQGIRHVVSRSHHPETLGKCERFWETVGQEFWSRVQPQELGEAQAKLAHFVAHYNHFRPHQGIDGSVPADRFFGAESQVRKAVEAAMNPKGELGLAVDETPRKSVFLVGQFGDQSVSLHGERGKLILQTSEGIVQEVTYQDLGTASALPRIEETSHDRENKQTGEPAGSSQHAQPEPSGAAGDAPAPQGQGQEAQAEFLDDHAALAGPLPVGDGQPRGEAASAPDGCPSAGTVAGPDIQEGIGGEDRGAALEGVAALPAGPGGDGGGVAEAAQETAQGDAPAQPASAGQPPAAEGAVAGGTEAEEGAGGTGGYPEGLAGQPGAAQG